MRTRKIVQFATSRCFSPAHPFPPRLTRRCFVRCGKYVHRHTPRAQPACDVHSILPWREHYYQVRIQNPPCADWREAFHGHLRHQDPRKPTPILLTRTPYSVKPYGEDLYPDPAGPLQQYARSSCFRDAGRAPAAMLLEASSFTCGPQRPADAGAGTSTRAPMPYDNHPTGW